MVLLEGSAPSSLGYQPNALLLSYKSMVDADGLAPSP